MFAELKAGKTALALLFVAAVLAPTTASAISADVAKRCDNLVARQFPPREPGNPAAGSAKGNSAAQRAYFSKCIANGGNMDNPSPPPDKDAK
jgi:hypothetical protein